MTPTHSQKRKFAYLGVIGIVALSLVGVACVASWRDMSFDSARWKSLSLQRRYGVMWSKRPSGDIQRAKMLNDLLTHRLKVGMSLSAVKDSLGEGEVEGGGPEGCVVYYDLLHEPRFDQQLLSWLRWRTREPYLRLEFPANNPKLVKVKVVSFDSY